MIESARKKFVAVTMGILFVVFIVVTVTVIFILNSVNNERIFSALQKTVQMVQRPLESADYEGGLEELRNFTAIVDGDGNINISFGGNINIYDRDEVEEIVLKAYERKSNRGKINSFYFLKANVQNETVIAVSDRSIESNLVTKTYMWVIVCELFALTFLFWVVYKLSYWVVKPISESFDKQKQFIADASHELKTPITVIEANTQALKSEQGDSNWVNNIFNQTQRMSQLVTDMIDLTKAESDTCVLTKVNLSTVVTTTAMMFDCVAFENEKQYTYEIADGIETLGDEKDIKRLVTILLENAIKYSTTKGDVKLSLQKADKTVLTVFNTGCDFDQNDKDKLFLRFFRLDKSRTRESGGSGLGLAIAKSICDKYKYKISIDCQRGQYTKFIVVF